MCNINIHNNSNIIQLKQRKFISSLKNYRGKQIDFSRLVSMLYWVLTAIAMSSWLLKQPTSRVFSTPLSPQPSRTYISFSLFGFLRFWWYK